MTKIITTIFLLLSCFTSNVFAESSVWKVSKGNNYFYLGGTIHVLTANDHPLPREFERAYRKSKKIVFETDLMAVQTREFQLKFNAAMIYFDERTLKSELSPQVYRDLTRFMKKRNISINQYKNYQPWAISLVLTMLEYERLGLLSEFGVDNHFYKKAIADRKTIISLETPEQQLSFISSMASADPDASVEYTISDLENLPALIKLMKKSWRKGELDVFENSSAVVRMKTEFPEVYKTLITTRNNNWMRKIPTFIEDRHKEFVLVGAMHLSGESGLINQLKEQGFSVEPF